MTTLVGNGSKGVVAFNVTKNDFGTFPQLLGVLINDLVEYEGGSETSCVSAVFLVVSMKTHLM